MAMVFEESVARDISACDFSRVYLLYGNDTYLKKYYLDKISQKAYDGDPFFNLQNFQGECNLQEVFDAINQFPMMGSKKCVTLSDYDYLHCSPEEFKVLCELIKSVDEGCVLVLRFDSLEFDIKHNAAAKKLADCIDEVKGKLVCLNHRTQAALVSTLISGAKKRGCILSDKDANLLIEYVGDDLNVLKNELDKLCCFVGNGKIDRNTIKNVTVRSMESSIYEYAQAIVDGNVSSALKMLDDFFYMRVEPFVILYTASSVFVDMYRVYAASKIKADTGEIEKDFSYGRTAFTLKKAVNNLKKLDFKKISLCFSVLFETDEKLKSTGNDPRTVLEKMTVKLVYIIIKGESVD